MERIENIDNVVFGNVKLPLKTSIAPTGAHRSAGEKHEIVIWVDMSGVPVKDLAEKGLAQRAVDFQRPRRLEKSDGVFKSEEQFWEHVEELGAETNMHFSDLGRSPSAPLTEEEAEQQFEASIARLTPEQLAKKAAELETRAKQAQAQETEATEEAEEADEEA